MSSQKIWLRAETKPAEARSAREYPAYFQWQLYQTMKVGLLTA